MTKIIFFGNGPLADYALNALKSNNCEIIFHAREKSDLEEVRRLKSADTSGELHGVLASFGVIIKNDVLDLFEPEGILNIHPSLLPKYRGPSPIESAILDGDTEFGVSVMKLAPAMDAGPIYFQTSITLERPIKDDVYRLLATSGANWLAQNIEHLPTPSLQDNTNATYTQKFDKSMSLLDPERHAATELDCQVRAFAGFPKSKFSFFGLDCIIISAHVASIKEKDDAHTLYVQCHDGSRLIIDEIQPAGRKVMDAKSFLNGYAR